ncbi:DUF982 domain-containing protein [Rhizobium sp. RU36D]|uniref:DUF982 domain-containing protein n=1 Tax=Rhizobium sp. RU36D TaxID=1907415 RepID=UPI0009D897E0|nr:DUF982 domain-containing protein [Rhizobium sp. RU36D]SMC98687.1 Protein of unknown function [Rhizobium sp. RU36D]
MSSKERFWHQPVHIVMPSGLSRSFKHPYDALDFLEYEWPTRRCEARHRAMMWCARALEAGQLTGLARRAFMRAAQAAGMSLLPGPAEGRA